MVDVGMEVHHPLLGTAVPTLDELRARTDERAGEALEIAGRLACHRIAEQRQLHARARKLDAAPWAGPGTRVRTNPEAIVPGDLLRALLVCEAELLAHSMGDDLRREAWAMEVATLGSWSGPARRALPRIDDFTLAIEPGWAQRFALHDVRHGKPRLTVPGLLSSLGFEGLQGLAAFSVSYEHGKATAADVASSVVQRLPREVGQRLHQPVPPAYLDRHGGLAALDDALSQAPGVLVVGSPRSGRSELLRAWVRRATGDGVRGDWQGRAVVLDPTADVPAGAVALLTAPRGDPEAAARWLRAHATELPSLRVAVVAEPAAAAELRRDVPGLEGFVSIEVPEVDPWSLAAIWLCHTIARPGLGLGHVLQALRVVGLGRAKQIDPWALEQLVSVPELLAFYDADAACEHVSAGADGCVLQLRPQADALERRVDPGLLEALGGSAGLERLRGLEARLRGLDGG